MHARFFPGSAVPNSVCRDTQSARGSSGACAGCAVLEPDVLAERAQLGLQAIAAITLDQVGSELNTAMHYLHP